MPATSPLPTEPVPERETVAAIEARDKTARALPIAHKDPRAPTWPACLDEASWLGSLQAIDAGAARTLVTALRTLYPHDALPDPAYRRVVVAFDRLATASPPLAGLLVAFVSQVDAASPLPADIDGSRRLPFAELSEGFRVTALKRVEATPAFRFVQRAGVRYLYDDLDVWQAFGYEGASHHLGGYIGRGFDDLRWDAEEPLQQPKESA